MDRIIENQYGETDMDISLRYEAGCITIVQKDDVLVVDLDQLEMFIAAMQAAAKEHPTDGN